jgi:hypothetical protein
MTTPLEDFAAMWGRELAGNALTLAAALKKAGEHNLVLEAMALVRNANEIANVVMIKREHERERIYAMCTALNRFVAQGGSLH